MPTDWLSQTARKIGDAFGARRDLLLPAAVLGLLVVLVVPLPAALLDLLLVANIGRCIAFEMELIDMRVITFLKEKTFFINLKSLLTITGL